MQRHIKELDLAINHIINNYGVADFNEKILMFENILEGHNLQHPGNLTVEKEPYQKADMKYLPSVINYLKKRRDLRLKEHSEETPDNVLVYLGKNAYHSLEKFGVGIQNSADITLNLFSSAEDKKESDERVKGRSAYIRNRFNDIQRNRPNATASFNGLISGVGQTAGMIPAAVATYINPAFGTAVIAADTFGNNYGEALVEGATSGEAFAYALGSTAIEVAIERLIGNKLMGGEGILNKKISRTISRVAKRPATQAAFKFIVDVIGEGGEEVATTAILPWVKRAIYDPDAELPTAEQLVEAGIGGMISGAVWGGVERAGRNTAFDSSTQNTESVHNEYDVDLAIGNIVDGTATFEDFKEIVLKQYPNMPDELIREGYNGLYGLTDDGGNDIIYYSLKNNLGSEKYAEQGNESFGNESIGRQTMGTDKIRTESNRVQNGKEYRTQRLGIWKKTYARIRGTVRNTQVKEITSDNSTIVYEEYSGAKSAHKFFVDFYNRDIGFAKGNIRLKGNDVFKADGVFVNGKIIATLADDTETIVMHEMVHEDLNSDMYKETVSKINACFDENQILKFVLDIHMKYSPIYSDVPNSTNAILSEVYSKTISNLATKEWYQDESGYELFANRDSYEKAKGIAEEYAAYLINNPPQIKVDTIIKDVSELGDDFADDYMFEKSENNPYFASKETGAYVGNDDASITKNTGHQNKNISNTNYDVDMAIGNIIDGTATDADFKLFAPKNTANRQALYEATGIKLPIDSRLTNYSLLALV